MKEVTREAGAAERITESWEYDENYNPERHTDGEGQIQEVEYDARNLPETVRRGLGANATGSPIVEQLTYDDNRRLEVFTGGLSNAWTRRYDGFGRTKEMLDPLGNKSLVEYDGHTYPSRRSRWTARASCWRRSRRTAMLGTDPRA